jgi:ABC-type multidrug transport system fused ATPase/permease subunit
MNPFRRLAEYVTFARKCFALMAQDKTLFALFLSLSVIGALTEGVTVSLLVPILQSQGNPGGFGNIPLLSHVAAMFEGLTPNQRIRSVAVAMALVFVLRGVLQYAIDVLGLLVPLRLQKQAVLENFRLMMAVRISYLNDRDFGTLSNDIGGWATRVAFLLTNFAILLWSLLVLMVYSAMMVSVSWRLTLLAMVFVVVISALLKQLSGGPLRRAGERLTEASMQLSQTTMETLGGMKLIRLAAAETLMSRLFQSRLEVALDNQRRQGMVNAFSSPFLSTSAGIFICFLLYASAVAHEGDPNAWVGSILIFLFLLFRLLGPVTQINNARNRIIGEMPAFEGQETFRRIAHEQVQPNGERQAAPLRDGVVLDDVCFRYDQGDRQVLQNVSATIERGRMTAVVGPSGAGKTTLIGLLTRLYDPQSGRILVDGVDLRDLDVRSWRRRLAVVSQDIFIFNDTVANNLCFGQGDVPMERLREAARLAAAEEFIDKLPQGYDTLLGDRGMRLSGGQQQRIAIARAILANPDLLIMDEATSHLDTFTERAIQEAVDRLSRDRTLLVIAHRLSTIRRADKVIVMKDGRIVEQGRHEELLAARGIYWEMVEHQRLDLVAEDREEAAAEALR